MDVPGFEPRHSEWQYEMLATRLPRPPNMSDQILEADQYFSNKFAWYLQALCRRKSTLYENANQCEFKSSNNGQIEKFLKNTASFKLTCLKKHPLVYTCSRKLNFIYHHHALTYINNLFRKFHKIISKTSSDSLFINLYLFIAAQKYLPKIFLTFNYSLII